MADVAYKPDTVIRQEGMRILLEKLGMVDATFVHVGKNILGSKALYSCF